MSRMNINVGDFVAVNTQTKPEYNRCLWKVASFCASGRVILETAADGSNSMVHSISVKQDAITSAALVPAHVSARADDDVMTLQRFVSSSSKVNIWLPLPGLGGNAILVREASANSPPLVMYNELRGHELWFHSSWNGDLIQLVDCDILKLCPARQVWPWCSWCQRFLCPPDAHRCSKRHAKLSFLLRDQSLDLDDLRRKVVARFPGPFSNLPEAFIKRNV